MRALEALGGLIVAICIGIGFFRLTMVVLRGATKPKDKSNNNEE